MIQSQLQPFRQRRHISLQGRSPLLQRHSVLLPMLLLSSSIILGIASFSAESLFPILALIGVPVALMCLSITFVLGIAGILASIIGILESIDRYGLRAAMFPKPKEHSYANRN